MPPIEIRPAALIDLAAISAFDPTYQTAYAWQMERLVEDHQAMINFREVRLPRPVTVDYPRSPDYMQPDWLERATILVALLNGSQVGYVRLKEQRSPRAAWVTDLVVREDSRRQGVGSVLVIASQEWAMKHELRRCVIQMQSKNHPAIRMARKLGYEFCGYNDHFYVNQDIALFFARYLR